MKRWLLPVLLFGVVTAMYLVSACQPAPTNVPLAPLNPPVLRPMVAQATPTVPSLQMPPRRILVIGSLFTQDLDTFLTGLVKAANPTAELDVTMLVLPAT